jgi:hypothetical protein
MIDCAKVSPEKENNSNLRKLAVDDLPDLRYRTFHFAFPHDGTAAVQSDHRAIWRTNLEIDSRL